jgi:hemerythrin-like domain-containing protein
VKSIKSHHSSIARELELVEPKVEGLEGNIKIQLNKLKELVESTEGSDI